jgi:hypothetical protein
VRNTFNVGLQWIMSNHKIPNSAYKLPIIYITEPKKRTWSLLLSNISCPTHNLQIRGHPPYIARQLKNYPKGRIIWGGGRSPTGTSPPAQAVGVQVASGYTPGDTLSGCCSSVVVPVSLAPSPPFSVLQQTERGLIKIFALLVQNRTWLIWF